MQPKLKSKVRTADRDLGEVTRVIVDPITHDVSHIVVGEMASGRWNANSHDRGAGRLR